MRERSHNRRAFWSGPDWRDGCWLIDWLPPCPRCCEFTSATESWRKPKALYFPRNWTINPTVNTLLPSRKWSVTRVEFVYPSWLKNWTKPKFLLNPVLFSCTKKKDAPTLNFIAAKKILKNTLAYVENMRMLNLSELCEIFPEFLCNMAHRVWSVVQRDEKHFPLTATNCPGQIADKDTWNSSHRHC